MPIILDAYVFFSKLGNILGEIEWNVLILRAVDPQDPGPLTFMSVKLIKPSPHRPKAPFLKSCGDKT